MKKDRFYTLNVIPKGFMNGKKADGKMIKALERDPTSRRNTSPG